MTGLFRRYNQVVFFFISELQIDSYNLTIDTTQFTLEAAHQKEDLIEK